MIENRIKLYTTLLTTCFMGYIWLYLNMAYDFTKNNSFEVCIIKRLTNIPCPSCGSTRSIISLLKGNYIEAFKLNPIGYILVIVMLIIPIWIFMDIKLSNNNLFRCYQKIEIYLKKPKYAVPLILFVVINWIWNIIKGL
jgi:hypothetical protein